MSIHLSTHLSSYESGIWTCLWCIKLGSLFIQGIIKSVPNWMLMWKNPHWKPLDIRTTCWIKHLRLCAAEKSYPVHPSLWLHCRMFVFFLTNTVCLVGCCEVSLEWWLFNTIHVILMGKSISNAIKLCHSLSVNIGCFTNVDIKSLWRVNHLLQNFLRFLLVKFFFFFTEAIN